ncbi:oxidoreductase [Bacillus timonensis]|nr:oxidoreductase [Bacillus timonensis]
MRKINVGLVGFGLSGKVFHAPFLHTHPFLHLHSVVERNHEHSKEQYPYVQVVKDYQALLNNVEIELVVITVPNEYHYTMARDALLANKHVVVEKPFTVTSSEAKELDILAKKQKKVISVYHNRRWDGDFLTVQKVLKEKLLGEVVEYEVHFDRFRNYFKENAWREKDVPGSGILYDLGSHLIDQAQVLFGMPNSVYADLRTQREGGKAIDSFDLHLDYGRLKVTLKAGMLVREAGPRIQIHGTNGSFVKYGLDPQEEHLRNGMLPSNQTYGMEDENRWGIINSDIRGLHVNGRIETIQGNYLDYYQNIVESIINRQEPLVTATQAGNTIYLIEKAIESASEKKKIQLV